MAHASNPTLVRAFDSAAIAEAAALIAAGQPVAVPTETVYGLAADARSADGVARIYAAKGRPDFNPLIVHVPTLGVAETLGQFGPVERALATRFWPGPLTLVVPRTAACPVASIATAATTRKMNAIQDSRPRRTRGRSKRLRRASTGEIRAAARAGSLQLARKDAASCSRRRAPMRAGG